MTVVHNQEVYDEIRVAAKIQPGSDTVPRLLSNQIVPVIEVNPSITKKAIAKHQFLNNATTATIYTTPTNQDFYITSVALSYTKDATATTTSVQIVILQNGAERRLLNLSTITLTAQYDSCSVSFPHPVLVDRNSIITIGSATNVANIIASACITGFLDEQGNG